jgi:cell division protein FtsB
LAVDPGLKDTYTSNINDAIGSRKDRLGRVRDLEAHVQFEQAAEAGLSAGDVALVTGVGVVGKYGDLATLRAEETKLTAEINALQNLRQAIKAL